ncbi:MAG: glycosyltransferase [Ignavibacteriaceae bacterium]
MKIKIAIVTSGHPPLDERIFYKFGKSLSDADNAVEIICSSQEINEMKDGISITGFNGSHLGKKEKILMLYDMILSFNPSVIICCEPLPVFSAYKFKTGNPKCKIILDITEWYPENLATKIKGIKKYFYYLFYYLFNFTAVSLSDSLIIGEITKKMRYNFMAPLKGKTIIGYYPVLHYFNYSSPPFNGTDLTFCYAGLINFQRGIITIYEVTKKIKEKYPRLNITLKLVGRFERVEEEIYFDALAKDNKSITIDRVGWTSYNRISEYLQNVDICFDLRARNFIYNNSLPIKIFEYMACGKPFIFSDIKPIRKEFGDNICGFLVDPSNQNEVISSIEKYIIDKNLLLTHSINARKLIENGRNWEEESKKLFNLVNSLAKNKN